MVYLNRIYTKTGDFGETSLGDGSRIEKTHPRVQAMGAVDELNAALGLAAVLLAGGTPVTLPAGSPDSAAAGGNVIGEVLANLQGELQQVQNDLFDLGADLAVPLPGESGTAGEIGSRLRITEVYSTRVEGWIDRWNAELNPLESFILPGGAPGAAALHWTRTICRRAESKVLELSRLDRINSWCVIYLNRLSDYLFVTARILNDFGRTDVLWTPGGGAAQV